MSKMNPVVHFELPAEDQQRMSEFYQKAFGWQTKQMGDDMGGLILFILATIFVVYQYNKTKKLLDAAN